MHPRFEVLQVSQVDGKIEVLGTASSEGYLGRQWLGEKWIGYLGRADEAPIQGRWFSSSGGWKFVTEDRKALDFKKEEELCLYDGYWGERAYIVLAKLDWKKEEFVPVKQHDHEHCAICWVTISSATSTTFFKSSEHDVVCPACYENFVVPGSLEFIEEGPTSR